jgi:hypothetical protein
MLTINQSMKQQMKRINQSIKEINQLIGRNQSINDTADEKNLSINQS